MTFKIPQGHLVPKEETDDIGDTHVLMDDRLLPAGTRLQPEDGTGGSIVRRMNLTIASGPL